MADYSKGMSMLEDSSNQNSQNISSISKISYRMGVNSLKMKKVFKERTKINSKNEENIKLNKKQKVKKLSKQPSCTTRPNTKQQIEVSAKSINKKKSKKNLKKSIKFQGSCTIQPLGKENRHPKTASRADNLETKRSSVPRIEGKFKQQIQKSEPRAKALDGKSKVIKSSNDSSSSLLGFSNSTHFLHHSSLSRSRIKSRKVDRHYSTSY